MKKDWDTVEVLRHARHDWLNKIQLIKGNLALNKLDRVKTIIDEIVMEAQNDSKLSNLNSPHFATLLFTYNWESHSFQLEFEVLNDLNQINLDDEKLTAWTTEFFSLLDTSIEAFHPNHLSISIEPHLNGARFFFDFSGIIKEKEQLEKFLTSHPSFQVNIQEWTDQELALELFIPTV
ncbi:sporulation initiation phosphotransferase B [Cytobacillus spongiae]|jgi:stage 0 sporulation protein B (sporulation initiation phosphotransferase)|uniref:sporulation initiation phosphotransferase B n=1 Tax=Cytobacillus spongiae TaxID=2901381 RepID=UPI001F317BBB|nr:sporulation initiation phosphotransferase B [Cytobacillus spongiae]UII55030.1 sporulation initiation phosphotransferase B [Cytobacillus spongiae]